MANDLGWMQTAMLKKVSHILDTHRGSLHVHASYHADVFWTFDNQCEVSIGNQIVPGRFRQSSLLAFL